MRLLPGQPQDVVGSITSYSLMRNAVANPDILPKVWQVFKNEEITPLSSILANKGYATKGLSVGMSNNKFRVVGSNHIMYPIASTDRRKCHIAGNSNGLSFYCPAYSTYPGKAGSEIIVYLDSNLPRPKEVIELADRKTKLYVYDTLEPVEVDGVWKYRTRLVTNDKDAYVDTDLLAIGSECAPVMTLYEQDFSETGSEAYTFNGWGHAYLSLQRVKMSFSGTAEAMNTSKEWYRFENSKGNSVATYIEYAERKMYKKAAQYHEYQMIYGECSQTEDGETFLKDKNGREILAGAGLLYGGDGAIDRPFTHQGWTKKYMESILMDADVRSGKDGNKELAYVGGMAAVMDFHNKMAEWGFVTKDNNVEGSGGDKGVNMTYKYYEIAGLRLYVEHYRGFDDPIRPTQYMSSGMPTGPWDGVIVPMGFNIDGDANIELVQLRAPVYGTVTGMNKGGEGMSSSVDGESRHYLWQDGIIIRVPVYYSYMPVAA